MERRRWWSASRGGKAPLKKRRLSPLPGAVGSRAQAWQPCRRQLFGSAGPSGGPQHASLKKKTNVKTLSKIKENVEVTQVSHSCSQSSQVSVREEIQEKTEESTVHLKGSVIINFESKESLKNTEVTSSTGMTLPTGVSTFLLDCLESDSPADYHTSANSSLSSCPSPETFRDDASERSHFYPEEPGNYKNSTLLDSSRAVAIDKIPQISNLSAILDPVGEDFQGQPTRRKRPPNYNYTSSALSVSTTLTGQEVCKITAARERTPDLNSGRSCSSPLGPESKPDKQTAKAQRLKAKEKENNSNALEEGRSALSQLGAPRTTSAQAEGLTAEVLPERVGPLCGRQEICSIVRTSPTQRPSRLQQIPVSTREFQLPKREPEDNITSTKNWICCKHR